MIDLNVGALAPVEAELTLADLVIEGAIPEGLCGRLLRNGPNPFSGSHSGTDMLDWWVEAAMLHAVDLDGATGTAEYKNRWMRTSEWARYHGGDADQGAALADSHNPHEGNHAESASQDLIDSNPKCQCG